MQEKRSTGSRRTKRHANRYSKTVIRWLICCFPAGLLMMWGSRCRWSRALKSAVSAGFALLLVLLIMPQTLPPEHKRGGVEVVSLAPALEVQGPVRDDEVSDAYESYQREYIAPKQIIIEPTPTPLPVYVYCNTGGKYYHTKDCKHVRNKKTTGRVTLDQALSAGYKRCETCKPAEEYAVAY